MGFEFELLGIPVKVTPGAFILAAVIVIFGLQGGSIVGTVAFLVVAFASILVHELGHALAARAFRLPVLEIVLHGVGGLTRHGRPDRPWKSLLISLAGPGAGFVLVPVAGFLAFGLALPEVLHTVAWYLFWVNLVWGIFNLLPIHPLDGGQALGAILAMFLDQLLALTIAAWTGLVGSVGLAVGALALREWWIAAIGGMMAGQNWQVIQGLRAAKAKASRAAGRRR